MNGFSRVEKECRRAGAGERRGDLPADDSGLAHAGHDHATLAVEQDPDGALEAPVQPVDEREDCGGLRLQHLPGEGEVRRRRGAHARTSDRAGPGMARSRATPSIRCSFRISGARYRSRKAFAASLFARDGSSWTSMNTASTPAATPADAIGSMYCARPPVTPSPAPGSCRLWVTSNTTGYPSSRSIGNARTSTTRLL